MIHLIGGGGHCKVVLDALLAGGVPAMELRVRDGRRAASGTVVLGVAVAWPDLDETLANAKVHICIGDNAVRARLTQTAETFGAQLVNVIHPRACLSPFARIGSGGFVAAEAVVGPDAVIGRNVIVNHGAVVDHDCRIGDHGSIGAGAVLGGGVVVGDGVTIGPRVVIPTGLTIGDGVRIAPGSVITRDLTDGEVWAPARDKTEGVA